MENVKKNSPKIGVSALDFSKDLLRYAAADTFFQATSIFVLFADLRQYRLKVDRIAIWSMSR